MDWNPLNLDLRRDSAYWCDYNPSQCKSTGYYEKQPFIDTLQPTCSLPYELEGPLTIEEKNKNAKDEKNYLNKFFIFSFIFLILIIIFRFLL
jgi:hypothetical protein